MLTADIICSQDTIAPEPIEKLVRNLLEGVLFKAEEVFLLKWQRTEKFAEQNAERTALIVGATMTFEIYELPCGLTASPDAIQAAQLWAEHWDKNLVVVGLTDFGEIFVPSRESFFLALLFFRRAGCVCELCFEFLGVFLLFVG